MANVTKTKKPLKRYFHDTVEDSAETKGKQKLGGDFVRLNRLGRKSHDAALKKTKRFRGQDKKDTEDDDTNKDDVKSRSARFKHNKQLKDKINKIGRGKPKIPKEVLQKYSRGEKVNTTGVKTNFFKAKQERKEIYLEYAGEQAARSELLLQEEQGFIEPDSDEETASYRQEEIVKNVSLQAAAKYFKLNLDFGPYSMRYIKNGRHLLLGGRMGHVAAFDWITKKLLCEINVMEEVADVCWLHVNTMFACAQKNWTYIYDRQGTELHCVKQLFRINRLEFLPYHFLLSTGNVDGYLSWLDVSVGEIVGCYNTHCGDLRLMRQNPANGVICVGNGKGVVSMWSPKVREPLAKILCHPTALSALAVDPKGMHLVTSGMDRSVKLWDIRALKGPLVKYKLHLPANQLDVSQRGVLAMSMGNCIQTYNNPFAHTDVQKPYLRPSSDGFVHGMQFCPYEDVLGVATDKGFQSLLIPGAGEANYDALEDNPFQTKSQRREREVHSLLEKVPPELITLDPNEIANVDVPQLQDKIEAKRALFHLKPPQIDFKARRKMKGRGGSVKAARNKQIVKDQQRKEFISKIREAKQRVIKEHIQTPDDPAEQTNADNEHSVLDRFKSKRKT